MSLEVAGLAFCPQVGHALQPTSSGSGLSVICGGYALTVTGHTL